MILEHHGKKPQIDDAAFVAPSATVCGDVSVGPGSRVMHGASIIAEGGSIEVGRNCIILENAVLRSTSRCSTVVRDNCLIGPNAHVVGCTIEANVFVATGVSLFHGCYIESECEIRVNGIVHTNSRLTRNSIVPIGWVAVGDPAEIFPPCEHEKIWSILKSLNFPMTVYGVDRPVEEPNNMPEITARLSRLYGDHMNDKEV
jgi:carbonic anhydrase/acetyltransferase-like protein (isoleucine patch superfamily)